MEYLVNLAVMMSYNHDIHNFEMHTCMIVSMSNIFTLLFTLTLTTPEGLFKNIYNNVY